MEDFRQFSSKSTLLGKSKPLTRTYNAVFKALFFNRVFCLSDSVLIKFIREMLNIKVLDVVTGLNSWILSLVDRVSVALNRTADHTDVLTTYAEVNIRVKKNSDNPASIQVVANVNFSHQQTYCIRYFTNSDDHIQITLIYESVTMNSYEDFELGGEMTRREIIYI